MTLVTHNASRGNTSRPAEWLEDKSKERLMRKAEALGHQFPDPKNVTKKDLIELLRTD